MKIPKHKCGLYLQHNEHRDLYQSAADWCNENSDRCNFRDDEQRKRAFATDEIWLLQWYPNTPIGCHIIAAPTLGELLDFAQAIEKDGE